MEKVYKFLKLFLSFILYAIAIPAFTLILIGASLVIAIGIGVYLIILPFQYVYYKLRDLPLSDALKEIENIVKTISDF